ncbi:MAG: hypothetical protein ABII01_05955 [Candidatus Woesearchaeota archaeon]
MLIILAFALIVLLVIFLVNSDVMSRVSTKFKFSQGRAAVNDIGDAAELVYQQGVGSKTKVYLSLPMGINSFTAEDRTVQINFRGWNESVYRNLGFKIATNRSLPIYEGFYWICIESTEPYVLIEECPLFNETGGETTTTSSTTTTLPDGCSGGSNISIALSNPSTDANFSYHGLNQFVLNVSCIGGCGCDINVSLDPTECGNYSVELFGTTDVKYSNLGSGLGGNTTQVELFFINVTNGSDNVNTTLNISGPGGDVPLAGEGACEWSGDIRSHLVGIDGNGTEECAPCDGKATVFTFRYLGATAAQVKVEQNPGGYILMDEVMQPYQVKTLDNGQDNQDTLGNTLTYYVDGAYNAELHTSCSVEIGPGFIFGDFISVTAISKNGGYMCPTWDDGHEVYVFSICSLDSDYYLNDIQYGFGDIATITYPFDGTTYCANRVTVDYCPQVDECDPLQVNKTGLVSMETNATPFYTITNNPYNLYLNNDESTLVTFWVNATGYVGTEYEFFAWANLTNDTTKSSVTDKINITIVAATPDDITPPNSITNLQNTSAGSDWIQWTWTNSNSSDFSANVVYLDSVWQANTSDAFFNATNLSASTSYTLKVHTKDSSRNVNDTDVTDAGTTSPATSPTTTTTSTTTTSTTTTTQPSTWATIFFDAFTRADSASIGGSWTETGGEWDILSNRAHADDCVTPGDEITTPNIDLSGKSSAILTYNWEYTQLDSGECLNLDLNDGLGWVNDVATYCSSSPNQDNSGIGSITIQNYIALTSTVQLRFDCLNNHPNDDVYVDKVNVSATT